MLSGETLVIKIPFFAEKKYVSFGINNKHINDGLLSRQIQSTANDDFFFLMFSLENKV